MQKTKNRSGAVWRQAQRRVSAALRKWEPATEEVREALENLQKRVIAAAGVASQSQVLEISREMSRLSKKVDGLVGKRPNHTADRN